MKRRRAANEERKKTVVEDVTQKQMVMEEERVLAATEQELQQEFEDLDDIEIGIPRGSYIDSIEVDDEVYVDSYTNHGGEEELKQEIVVTGYE